MGWRRCLKLAVPLVLLSFGLPVTGLIHPRRAEPGDIAVQDAISDFQLPIYHAPRELSSSNRIWARQNRFGDPHQAHDLNINATTEDTYWVSVQIGGQEIKLLLDTDSSDTWVITSPRRCLEYNESTSPADFPWVDVPPYQCGFGPTFDTETSETFQVINDNDTSFFASYYTDESFSVVTGYVGQDILNVSGVIINQVIGIANVSFMWPGDGFTSGVLGLAYPGTIPSEKSHGPLDWLVQDEFGTHMTPFDCHDVYPSFVENLATYNYKHIFSISLNRSHTLAPGNLTDDIYTAEGGLLTLGGIPNIDGLGDPPAKAKINALVNDDNACASHPDRIGYAIDIDGIVDGGEEFFDDRYGAKLDISSAFISFPPLLAKKVYDRINPDATEIDYPEPFSPWIIPCNSTIPEFGFVFAGVVISIDPSAVITAYNNDATGEFDEFMCQTIFSTRYEEDSDKIILGSPFFQEVLAEFDLGQREIRFRKRFAN
ncbi:hypothetical protein ABW21_db0207730 [Orbilia brochopaga]|nr:hypothetical protein ABW21_db0207730 [Drechslerella brochopaga]